MVIKKNPGPESLQSNIQFIDAAARPVLFYLVWVMNRGLRAKEVWGWDRNETTLNSMTNEDQYLKKIANAFFEFRDSDLFRISNFGFRISLGACLTNYLSL
jgi:hypothetical protein